VERTAIVTFGDFVEENWMAIAALIVAAVVLFLLFYF
jgi:hypothetical protein